MRYVTWLSEAAWAIMVTEADAREPLETGGVLLGYWANARECVVTAASGPGVDAIHCPHRFKPDHSYQEQFISERYRATKGIETYLGDWHTHPGTKAGWLSRTDKATSRRVARSDKARAPKPLTLILAGERSSWAPFLWIGELVPLIGSWRRLRMQRADLLQYKQ